MRSIHLFSFSLVPLISLMTQAEAALFDVKTHSDRLVVTRQNQPVLEFVWRDPQIRRPYFANVCAPGGFKVTRHHPPVSGQDAIDHAAMHPGVWLAFGDINGVDFWRNQGVIEQVRFIQPPPERAERLSFSTECLLRGSENRTICSLTNRFALAARPEAWLLIWDATFWSETEDFTFGDQEEMGFGARVATAITEKNGGLITSSAGLKTAQNTWGQLADWCDYSRVIEGRKIGLALMAHPDNFRRSWWHNRDYGLLVANPFGRAALRQGAKSAITVKKGEPFRLRFGALIHSSTAAHEVNLTEAYQAFVSDSR